MFVGKSIESNGGNIKMQAGDTEMDRAVAGKVSILGGNSLTTSSYGSTIGGDVEIFAGATSGIAVSDRGGAILLNGGNSAEHHIPLPCKTSC